MGTTTGAWYVTRTVTAEPGPSSRSIATASRSWSRLTAARTAASLAAPSSAVTEASRAPARAASSTMSWSFTSSPTCTRASAMVRRRGRIRANSTAAEPRSLLLFRPMRGSLPGLGDLIDDLVEERRQLPRGSGPCDQDDGDRGRGQDDQGVLGGRLTLLSTERQPSCGPVPDQGAHLRSQPRPRSNVQLEHVVHLLSFRPFA